ncbi:MAG: porin family protein [Planctomycetota bacterium]|jgi:opacity protein-like surface antigen
MGTRLAILPLCFAIGCATPANKEITTSDGPIVYPTGRVAVSVLPRSTREGKTSYGIGEIEVDLSGGWGDGQQQIDAGEIIRVGDYVRSGPALLNIDYSLFQASAAFRGGWRAKNWQFLGLGGLGYVRSKVKVNDGVDGGEVKEDSLGPLLGLQISFEPLKRFDLYGRASLLYTDDNESQQAELGLGYSFVDWGRVFVAYRWWRYEFEPDTVTIGGNDLTNHLDLRTNGVVLGLEFRF